jgi:hypothetical protein
METTPKSTTKTFFYRQLSPLAPTPSTTTIQQGLGIVHAFSTPSFSIPSKSLSIHQILYVA